MDANVRDVLVAALPVIGGVLVGVLVAKITADRSRQVERERWKRELYATFIHATNEVRDAIHEIVLGGQPDDGWTEYGLRAQKALIEIRMIAAPMRLPAEAVWDATNALRYGVLKFAEATATPNGPAVPIDHSHYPELDEGYRAAMMAFIDRASEDLD